MEFQFGTNWARFSRFAGGVIGQTLAMEGMFAFFLESSFLGLFLFGEKRLSPRAHLAAAFAVFAGSWLSGYFIVATDAWMQHPVGYTVGADGVVQLQSLSALLLNRWAFWQYLHTMGGALVTGAFATAGLGAYYLLRARAPTTGRRGGAPARPASWWPPSPASGRSFPPATGRASWSRPTNPRRWRRWRGSSRPVPARRWCWSGSRTPTSDGSTTRWRSRRR